MKEYNPIPENLLHGTSIFYTWKELLDPNKYQRLPTGEYAIKRFKCNYNKYAPGIIFLINEENCLMEFDNDLNHLRNPLNINFDGRPEFMYGDFWISKKGSTCFRPNPSGDFVLIQNSWGGPFEKSRGTEYEEFSGDALYCRRTRSNGGGYGINYYIFRSNFTKTVDLDEIY